LIRLMKAKRIGERGRYWGAVGTDAQLADRRPFFDRNEPIFC
jgi:hypothetical protein